MISEAKHREKISETPFLKRVGGLMGEIIGKRDYVDNKTGKILEYPNYIETRIDEYVQSVFTPLGNILNIYEQLEFISIFISKYPTPKFYDNNGINQPKYLQYHIENHFLKIATIFDLSVILTSEVFHLGIPPKLTSINQLLANKHTKNSKSVKVLRNFDKGIQGIKTKRNLITHRGEFSDHEIDKALQYFFLSDEKTNNKPFFSKKILDFHMKNITKNKLDFIKSNNEKILSFIETLFNESLLIFEKKLKELDTN